MTRVATSDMRGRFQTRPLQFVYRGSQDAYFKFMRLKIDPGISRMISMI